MHSCACWSETIMKGGCCWEWADASIFILMPLLQSALLMQPYYYWPALSDFSTHACISLPWKASRALFLPPPHHHLTWYVSMENPVIFLLHILVHIYYNTLQCNEVLMTCVDPWTASLKYPVCSFSGWGSSSHAVALLMKYLINSAKKCSCLQ